jgi:HSP20 family molecular chaperone IbpA
VPHQSTNWMCAEACALIERTERMQRDFCRPLGGDENSGWEPPIDIYETERQLWVQTAQPGVKPWDLKLAIVAHLLAVTGVRPVPSIARKAKIHRLEIPYGRFERRMPFGSTPIELNQWDLDDGCLSVVLTKPR